MSIRTIETRLVELPVLRTQEESSASVKDLIESNSRLYNYAQRSARPTLEDYVWRPFRNNLKNQALQQALQSQGLGFDDTVEDDYTFVRDVEPFTFEVEVSPSPRVSYETVTSRFRTWLSNIVREKAEGIKRDEVRTIEGMPYPSVDYLIQRLQSLKEDNTTLHNSRRLSVLDQDDERYPLDESIERMKVELDRERHSVLNKVGAEAYQDARSLRKRIRDFEKAVERWGMDLHGIKPDGTLDENVERMYEMSNGAFVRFLFSSKTSVRYGGIFKGLMEDKEKHKREGKVSRSTGDLLILQRQSFEDFRRKWGQYGLDVKTELKREGGRQAIVSIKRFKEVDDRRSVEDSFDYNLYRLDDRVFVNSKDVLERYQELKEQNTTRNKPEFQLSFFPEKPENL